MRITRDPLLLRATDVSSPLDRVVAELFGPVVHPLKMVFRFFQRAVALIYAQRVSEIETTISVYVERRHATGFRGASIETGEPGVGRRSSAHSVRLDANPV